MESHRKTEIQNKIFLWWSYVLWNVSDDMKCPLTSGETEKQFLAI